MSTGNLVVSILPHCVMLEMFKIKGKKRILVQKEFEDLRFPLTDLNNVDVVDLENVIYSFIEKGSIKKGKVDIVLFGDENSMDFKKITFETSKKSAIKKMLPIEIEGLGDFYSDFEYKYILKGNVAHIYFLKKSIVKHLGSMDIRGLWDIHSIVPGYVAYQGAVVEYGAVVDMTKDEYNVYIFKDGLIDRVEKGNVFTDFGLEKQDKDECNYIFESIQLDVRDIIVNYNLDSDGNDIDIVYVTYNDKMNGDFEDVEDDGLYFRSVIDLRDIFYVDEDLITSDKDDNEKIYSTVSLGIIYSYNELHNFSFSQPKLEYFYKNILISSVAFSLSALIVFPLGSLYIDNNLEGLREEVNTYKVDVNDMENLINQFEEDLENNESTIQDYNEYVRSLERLSREEKNFISGVLGYLPENTPNSVIVNSIRLEKEAQSLVLKGVSENYKDVGSFAIELEEYGRVDIVNIENNDIDNTLGYPFELELRSY